MERWSKRSRWPLLVVVSLCCVVFGAAVLYAAGGVGPTTFSRASTPELAGLLGLFVLPWMTLAADRVERRARRRRRFTA